MSDEELAELYRYHVTLLHRYHDHGGWDYELEYVKTHPWEDVWEHFVHRTYLNVVKKLVADLEGEVDRETIIKVIKAL